MLLNRAQDAGIVGGSGSISGNASVRIDLNGFPRGTRTQASAAGIFKEVALNRGKAMPLASQEQ